MKFQDHINKGNEYTKKGHYKLAIAQYNKALPILQTSDYAGFCDKETALVHANLADAYKNDGRPKEAIIHYNKALTIYLELFTNNINNEDIANCHKQIKLCQERNEQTLESMKAPDDNNEERHDDSTMLIGDYPTWRVINILDN